MFSEEDSLPPKPSLDDIRLMKNMIMRKKRAASHEHSQFIPPYQRYLLPNQEEFDIEKEVENRDYWMFATESEAKTSPRNITLG